MNAFAKKIGIAVLFYFVLLLGGRLAFIAGRAQTVVPPLTIQSTVVHTACVLPPTGTSAYCFASDGLWESINGAAYAQVNPPIVGVSSVAVNGGTPQTGAVVLTIPTTATTTGTFTTTIH